MGTGRKKLALDGCYADKMSGLPTHVLDKIFERLPIRDVARTSILSKKWRYIWSATPYLVFDQQCFQEITANKPNAAHLYASAIHKVVLLHKGPVVSFDLYIPVLIYPWGEAIDEWLLFLSKNGIQKLKLDYKCPFRYRISSCVFYSPTLISIRLVDVIFKPPVGFSGLANLVQVYLENITFTACEFNKVSPVAPLLKKLFLEGCIGIDNFTLFAPQVSILGVVKSTVVTPIFFDNFPNPDLILIIMGQHKGSPLNLYELHGKYPKAAKLRFDGCYLKRFAVTSIERSPSFMLLSDVTIYSLSLDDWDQISCVLWLLKSSPKMAVFRASVLLPSTSRSTADVERVLAHLESPDCLGEMLNLEIVKFYILEASKPELAFFKCILAHSPKLERLHIKYYFGYNDQVLKLSNELSQFPRASNKAKLTVKAVE